jgi:hypothetical protein
VRHFLKLVFLKKVMRTNWSPEFSNYKIKFDTLLAPALLSKPKISRYSAPLTLVAGAGFCLHQSFTELIKGYAPMQTMWKQ